MGSAHPAIERFWVYNRSGWLRRWRLHRLLRFICEDAESLDLLLGFEGELVDESLSRWDIYEKLKTALIWYNQEFRDNQEARRNEPVRLASFLRVVLIFLKNTQHNRLNRKHRDLLLNIYSACDEIEKCNDVGLGMPADQFRREVIERITSLYRYWNEWHEATSVRAQGRLSCFLSIARKVSDIRSFSRVCEEFVRPLGYATLSSLMSLSSDLEEFERFYSRLSAQMKFWRPDYKDLIHKLQDSSDLNHFLVFLETLVGHPRMQRCVRYHDTKNRGQGRITLRPLCEAKDACLERPWQDASSYDQVIEDLIGLYVRNIIHWNLRLVWQAISARKLRWEFDTFTAHVPYGMRDQDWTIDSNATRRYWNWKEAADAERARLFDALTPGLCLCFQELEFADFDLLISLLPNYIGVQRFTKAVRVPVEWEKGTALAEAYDKWAGWHYEKYEVARPTGYEEHVFAFERPHIQDAVDLVDNAERAREIIQTNREAIH
jgi:hypothetical protein